MYADPQGSSHSPLLQIPATEWVLWRFAHPRSQPSASPAEHAIAITAGTNGVENEATRSDATIFLGITPSVALPRRTPPLQNMPTGYVRTSAEPQGSPAPCETVLAITTAGPATDAESTNGEAPCATLRRAMQPLASPCATGTSWTAGRSSGEPTAPMRAARDRPDHLDPCWAAGHDFAGGSIEAAPAPRGIWRFEWVEQLALGTFLPIPTQLRLLPEARQHLGVI